MVRRSRSLIAVSLLVPMVGSGVAWVLPLALWPHGDHHVALHSATGRLAIVMEHVATEPEHDHDAPGASHSHAEPQHDDHVIVLSAPDSTSIVPVRHLPGNAGPAVILSAVVVSEQLRAAFVSHTPRDGVGPPVPSRSSILRI